MKNVMIDNRMRECEKKCLQNRDYNLVEIPNSTKTYPEISSHVDIFVCKINETVFAPQSICKAVLEPHFREKM